MSSAIPGRRHRRRPSSRPRGQAVPRSHDRHAARRRRRLPPAQRRDREAEPALHDDRGDARRIPLPRAGDRAGDRRRQRQHDPRFVRRHPDLPESPLWAEGRFPRRAGRPVDLRQGHQDGQRPDPQTVWRSASRTSSRPASTRNSTRIITNKFATLYYISHLLVKKSLDDGYLVGSRGSVGLELRRDDDGDHRSQSAAAPLRLPEVPLRRLQEDRGGHASCTDRAISRRSTSASSTTSTTAGTCRR
ncbi:MAG: hypothetical protein MZU97_09555 [Bacillus subtilis]|nr:hypothetical protein [Bacillus subtilis]